MLARILNGKEIAEGRLLELKRRMNSLVGERSPCLVTILVGTDPASEIYIAKKHQACQELGFISKHFALSEKVSKEELAVLINNLNQDSKVDGILLQLPLPPHLPTTSMLNLIAPDKDVDGFHPQNVGKLSLGLPGLFPCTPIGIIHLLAVTGRNLVGLNGLVIGASNIVGKPMAVLLVNAKVTTLIAQETTQNLAYWVAQADLVISAVGKPGLIRGEWLKRGSIVIDVGMNRLPNGSLVGDVDFKSAIERAAWITPVPGGVGPMTVAVLMENTWQAYLFHMERRKND